MEAPGSGGKNSFSKRTFNGGEEGLFEGWSTLTVATLEVDGTIYRSLDMHNTDRECINLLSAIFGPGMVLMRIFKMMKLWDLWKRRQEA